MRKLELHWQILISIIAAAIVGGIVFNSQAKTGVDATVLQSSVTWMSIFEYIGTMFLNALKMIIVPLITSSIIIGVAGIGSGGNLGALGGNSKILAVVQSLHQQRRPFIDDRRCFDTADCLRNLFTNIIQWLP